MADSIVMTRVVDSEADFQYSAESSAGAFKFSPDQSRFVAVTRKGNLTTGMNEYSLLLFNRAEVARFIRSKDVAALPGAEVLVTFEISSPRTHQGGITGVKWMSGSETLAFIGRRDDGIGQVYSLNLRTRELRQLTHQTEDIAEFDLILERHALIYSAYVTPNWSERNKHGYAVKSEPINYLVMKDPKDSFKELTYFAADLDSGAVVPVIAPAGLPGFPTGATTLSPYGRTAIVLMKAPSLRPRWAEYDYLKPMLESASKVGGNTEATSNAVDSITDAVDDDWSGGASDESWRLQVGLVDLASGITRPIVDAPVFIDPIKVFWSPDGSSVIVGPTLLPLAGVPPAEVERRRRFPAIAEIEIATGKITRVSDIVPRTAPNGRRVLLAGVERLSDGRVVIRERVSGGGFELPLRSFRKHGDRWLEERKPARVSDSCLQIRIAQTLNTPPEIAAVDRETGRSRIITDLNPQFRKLSLGRAEPFTWMDRLSRTFLGGLVFPPEFKEGVRYPVIIQDYWHNAGQFIVDGSPANATSAFAARALASRGMLVLQMDADVGVAEKTVEDRGLDTRGDWQVRGENPRAVAALEGAIDALAGRGLIDRDRVGLIGWSRSGMHVLHAITFANYPIAAATIADSHATTPWLYVMTYGSGGMTEWESDDLIGASFWGEGIRLWQERSPAFHLDRIRTPLRYEHYGTYPPGYWDTFALLKRHSRPVEMIHLPLATHNLENPHARYTSQQGNVDWFDFWLNGHEDPDPAKAEQYARWRKLRRQHEAHMAEIRASGNAPLVAPPVSNR